MVLLLLFFSAVSLLSPLVSAAASPRFQELRARSFPIHADDKTFANIVATPARDYSTLVLLTAREPRYGCRVCRDFAPEWNSLAKVWQKQDKQGLSGLVFLELDFANGRQTFQSLQLERAPVLYLYPPTRGPNAKADAKPLQFEFTSELSADSVHSWLSSVMDTTVPKYTKPFNWAKFLTIAASVTMGLLVLAFAAPYLLPVLRNRNLWAAGALILILLFTSGHMYNHIRKVPYVAGDDKGSIAYVAPGFQNQYGLETQIIALMYGILSFAAITLAVKVPRIANAKGQTVFVIVWGTVIHFVFGLLLRGFQMKNGGYPSHLMMF